jgi:E3 ubiquitin-protein ligase synoviolin
MIDTLLAMTMFRNDFDTTFFAMFTWMLFLKFFHWAARLRTDYVGSPA